MLIGTKIKNLGPEVLLGPEKLVCFHPIGLRFSMADFPTYPSGAILEPVTLASSSSGKFVETSVLLLLFSYIPKITWLEALQGSSHKK